MFDMLQPGTMEGPQTFAEPGDNSSLGETMARVARNAALYSNPIGTSAVAATEFATRPDAYLDLFRTAERQQRVVDNVFARTRAQEEAYDRWIATVRSETGVELENPLRGGYAREARFTIREDVRNNEMQSIEGTGGVPERQVQLFNQHLDEVRAAYPDKNLTFRPLDEEARAVAGEAEAQAHTAAAAPVDPVLGLAAQFAGGLWAGRRDPLFVGSLFLGPTSAVGKAALTRIATAGLTQGAFNAGLTALEQPAVQAWRRDAGLRSGVEPAVENVGMAFLFGLIPGAIIRGAHESTVQAARPALRRVLDGQPQPGDAETALRAVSEAAPDEPTLATVRMGEEMQQADTELARAPRDVPPELHNDMTAAALRHADDPLNQPSPEAVAAMRADDPEITARIEDGNPQTQHDAEMIASDVIEERGTRDEASRLRQELDQPPPEPTPVPAEERRPARDMLEKIPFIRDDGTPTTITRGQLAKIGERENDFAMLVRSCK